MTQIIRKVQAMAMMGILASLFAFTTSGGEGFEIYLDSKLVLHQFGKEMNTIKTIQLDQGASNAKLVVRYHHCGQVGKNRSITLRDAQNKILKEWKFADASAASITSTDFSMAFKVKDILSVQKNNPGKLNLYYISSELPKGRVLAYVSGGELAKAK